MIQNYEFTPALQPKRAASVDILGRGERCTQLSAHSPLLWSYILLVSLAVSLETVERICGLLVFVSSGRCRLGGKPHSISACLPLVVPSPGTENVVFHGSSRSIRQHRGSHERSHFEFPPLLPLYSLSPASESGIYVTVSPRFSSPTPAACRTSRVLPHAASVSLDPRHILFALSAPLTALFPRPEVPHADR